VPRAVESKLQLIAVELDAPWPAWLEQPASGARRVISELDGETPTVFAARVGEEVARERLAPASAVLLCNGRSDAAQTEARRALGQSLLGDKKAVPLTIAAPAAASERLQRALSTLANELGRRAIVRNETAADTHAKTVSRVASVA
jgi:hypothetical protein